MKAKETYIDLKHISFLVSDGFLWEDICLFILFVCSMKFRKKDMQGFFLVGGRDLFRQREC